MTDERGEERQKRNGQAKEAGERSRRDDDGVDTEGKITKRREENSG